MFGRTLNAACTFKGWRVVSCQRIGISLLLPISTWAYIPMAHVFVWPPWAPLISIIERLNTIADYFTEARLFVACWSTFRCYTCCLFYEVCFGASQPHVRAWLCHTLLHIDHLRSDKKHNSIRAYHSHCLCQAPNWSLFVVLYNFSRFPCYEVASILSNLFPNCLQANFRGN